MSEKAKSFQEIAEQYGFNGTKATTEDMLKQTLVNQYAILSVMSQQLMSKKEFAKLLEQTLRCIEEN